MQRPLDPLSFKKNVYERPNQGWVCGQADAGHACPLGPDARGGCRHTGACFPAKKEDRWFCTRGEAQGGKCTDGPLPDGKCSHPIPPCQPLRSLRKARALYVWLALALTSGALLVLLGQMRHHPWMNPGPLTNAHATSAAKCSDCHSLESINSARLVVNSLGQRGSADSALCLQCHQLGDQPLRPHSLAPARLAEIQKKLSPGDPNPAPAFLRVSRAFVHGAGSTDQLACAACHQEHHGRNFNLSELTDTQCQVCHSVQFASFEKGHPEFTGYPSQRRTRIFFDHNSHLGPGKHFEAMKDKAPDGCQSCHVSGAGGRFMEVKSFNATCAACHSAQIKGEGMTVKGVAFFTVPGIDADTLATKGISIGQWPKFADGKITPFMEVLLDRQPAMHAALEKLRGVDLLDLSKATPEQLAAAEQFAWGVKTSLFNLVVEGQSYLLKEMKGEIAPVGLEVPRAALIAAQEEWMPKLLGEVADYQKGIKPPLAVKPAPPTGSPSPSPAEKAPTGDASLLGDEDLAAATPTPSSAKPAATPGGDLLAGGDDLAAATLTPAPSPGKDEDLTSGDLSQATSPSTSLPTAAPTPEAMSAEEWVAAGGWYRPKDNFTLFYRPIGHADPFLAAWLTAAAGLRKGNATATSETPTAFQRLADPQNPGLCMKCHTAEDNNGITTVNWLPAQPNKKSRPFTTFSHTTHFSLVGDKGCQTCHALDSKSQYATFFSGETGALAAHDSTKFQSNFVPISKMLCAQCHQPRVAGDSCVLCHRYHASPVAGELADVGRFRPTLSTKLVPESAAPVQPDN